MMQVGLLWRRIGAALAASGADRTAGCKAVSPVTPIYITSKKHIKSRVLHDLTCIVVSVQSTTTKSPKVSFNCVAAGLPTRFELVLCSKYLIACNQPAVQQGMFCMPCLLYFHKVKLVLGYLCRTSCVFKANFLLVSPLGATQKLFDLTWMPFKEDKWSRSEYTCMCLQRHV